MNPRRCLIRVDGRVQGVGFRFFTRNTARKHGLTGWVRNCPDRSVEIEAQGSESAVDTFTAAIKAGPPLARVTEIKITELPLVEQEHSFEVRY